MTGGIVSKLSNVVESVKDILPSVIYETKTLSFSNHNQFLVRLLPGDVVRASDSASAVSLAPGSEHEIESVDGQVIVLSGGGRYLSEWFLPRIRRRQRIRRKLNPATIRLVVRHFVNARWIRLKSVIGDRVATARAEVAKAERDVADAEARLRQAKETALTLEAVLPSDSMSVEQTWQKAMESGLSNLLDDKLYANFEIVREDIESDFADTVNVLHAYTGPISLGSGLSFRRVEYLVKVYPEQAKTRIIVENITPGAKAGDVPHNENRTGVCNVCFGGQNEVLARLVDDEEWAKALTMIRLFLAGNYTDKKQGGAR